MKNYYWLLILLFTLTVQGQNFRPFRPGLAQYSTVAGDTVRLLQLADYCVNCGGYDSLYQFTPRAKINTRSCGSTRYSEGPLGDAMGTNNRGFKVEYSLLGNLNPTSGNYGLELLLKPYAPINQVWTATRYGHTGRVVARTLQAVLGVPDSVVTIALSGGQQVLLSKSHGLLEGPALSYFAGRAARRQVLTALPAQRLGRPLLGAMAVYDFQPGDRFVYQYSRTDNAVALPTRLNYLFSDSILARVNSRSGDTVTYRVARFSQQNNTITVSTVRYTAAGSLPKMQDSQQFIRTRGQRRGVLWFDGVLNPAYPTGRVEQWVRQYDICGTAPADTLSLSRPVPDAHYTQAYYGVGLGKIGDYDLEPFALSVSTVLVGYRKGSETWGTLPRMAYGPLAVGNGRPAATTAAFPNPFGAELSVAFTLAHAQAVALTVHDGLGRVVLARPAALLPGGAQQLVLPTASLPVGVYSLHIQFVSEGRTEVLRVLKTN